MKFALGIIFALVAGAIAQQETVTEGLLRAQADLTLGHRFFETVIDTNRGQISAYLFFINQEILASHIDTYAVIKNRGIEVRETLAAIPVTNFNEQCVNDVRARWELQVVRFGIRLANCVDGAYQLLFTWNEFINDLHTTGQFTGNQVQNLGVKTLSDTEEFTGRNDFSEDINREFRIVLQHFLAYRDRFDGFLDEISLDVLDTIRILVECDEVLEADFEVQAQGDLAQGVICEGLNP